METLGFFIRRNKTLHFQRLKHIRQDTVFQICFIAVYQIQFLSNVSKIDRNSWKVIVNDELSKIIWAEAGKLYRSSRIQS